MITVENTQHFLEKKMEIIQLVVSKNSVTVVEG
jgi:hypothetical protein